MKNSILFLAWTERRIDFNNVQILEIHLSIIQSNKWYPTSGLHGSNAYSHSGQKQNRTIQPPKNEISTGSWSVISPQNRLIAP